MTGEPIKSIDPVDPKPTDNSLLLPGLAKPLEATSVSGGITGDTKHELTPEEQKLAEQNSGRFAPPEPNNPPVLEHGRIQDNDLTNQDGQPLDGKLETGDPKSMPLTDGKFKTVTDKVSGNTVVVRNHVKETETVELQRLMKVAHDSLGDAQISDISTGHPYWGLQEAARRYGKEHGLL